MPTPAEVMCELLQWQLNDKTLFGEVYRSRDIRKYVDGEKLSFTVQYMVHYPKGFDEDEYFLARVSTDDYVKIHVAEKEEWPEALKVLLSKPRGTGSGS